MLSRKVEYLRYAEVKGKNSRTIWPDMTAFSNLFLCMPPFLELLLLFQSLCVWSEWARERELLLLVYIMIKFLFISSALSRIGENEPSSSIKRPLACSKLCWLLSREKAFIAAEVVANNQVSSRVTEDYIYTIGSGRSDITSKLQLKIYYCTGLFLRRWWWWRKCATTFHQIMNFTHP